MLDTKDNSELCTPGPGVQNRRQQRSQRNPQVNDSISSHRAEKFDVSALYTPLRNADTVPRKETNVVPQ